MNELSERQIVINSIQNFLSGPSGPGPGHELPTIELAEAIWPIATTDFELRRRLLRWVFKLYDEFYKIGVVHKGPIDPKRTKRFGKAIRPWVWHSPVHKACPSCGFRFDVV